MRRLLAVVCALGFALCASPAWAGDGDVIDHSGFDALLKKYVDEDGQVAYAKWKKNEEDLEKLRGYVEKIAEADPSEHGPDAQLAFYINAYNATVLGSIINHWPTESPMKIKGFFKVETHPIAGKEMTLDTLEHGLIRKKFDEARIHFVLVCAAKSCPRLRQKALTADNLEATLEAATREFVPQATELKEGTVRTSQLFNWFSEDFEEAAGSVREYLAEYTDGEVAEALGEKDVEIEFTEYDWAVNAQ
jgi:hypothetical protein